MKDGLTTGFLDDIELGDGEEDGGGVDYQPDIHMHSSEDMSELDDESVHLVVTSPPYNVGWEYGDHDDSMHYRDEYFPMLARVFNECHRVLVPGGRMLVNVPTLVREGREGGFSLASHIETLVSGGSSPFLMRFEEQHHDMAKLYDNTSFVTREYIIWNKGFNTDGLAPNGSFPKPWGILLNNMHEAIIVFQKEGERDVSEIDGERKEESEINKKKDDLCDDVWDISPESWDFEDEEQSVPVFPEEIPRRAIRLWTYKDDTVLDPFGGRGTTAKVAKELERHSVIYEKRESLESEIKDYVGYNQMSIGSW